MNDAPRPEIAALPREARRNEPPGLFASALLVLRKDLLIEWRTKARLNALLFFAVNASVSVM